MEFLAFLLYTTILEGSVFVYDKELLPGEIIEEGILEAKTECYAKDKVKSPPCFRSFYDDF